MFESLPKNEYDRLVAACDIGLIFLDHRFTIPNFPSRLLSYLNASIPVFACTDTVSDIGKIIVEERGSGGAYNVVYLIDKKNRTDFKIMGLHYKNFDNINAAILLETIDFNPTVGEYYKLLFFERITIKKSSINKSTNKKLNKILIAIQIMSVIGLLLFVIVQTIKIALKL